MTYEINKTLIGKKIEDIRKSHGLSMAEFAAKIGVTKGAINNYEKGRVIPKNTVLNEILNYDDSELTREEFIFGSFKEYLEELFSELPNFENNKEWMDIIIEINLLFVAGEIDYEERARIFRKAHLLNPELTSNDEFFNLWEKYIIEKNSYDVLSNDIFYNDIIPVFERDFLDLENNFQIETVDFVRGILTAIRKKQFLQNSGDFFNYVGINRDNILKKVDKYETNANIHSRSELEEYTLATEYEMNLRAWDYFFIVLSEHIEVPLSKFLKIVSDSEIISLIEERKKLRTKKFIKELKDIRKNINDDDLELK
ncbi:helix-turn-helix domain-containing protein [Streptococcus uberis]|uniref:helix-turn-helix domain-containing protein n=1 Tax=Streptococcus uberis TaxID=1349 RepID=UPI0012B55E88|nr:helix-turn-helix transcriptional regulator [Streptococcus uberis]MTC89816.1 helix-turn-helix domain-containing protein [Streptococcus uberis]MTC96746.1 helix-turn-helix domain-containing protein [Streptococcus uberis]